MDWLATPMKMLGNMSAGDDFGFFGTGEGVWVKSCWLNSSALHPPSHYQHNRIFQMKSRCVKGIEKGRILSYNLVGVLRTGAPKKLAEPTAISRMWSNPCKPMRSLRGLACECPRSGGPSLEWASLRERVPLQISGFHLTSAWRCWGSELWLWLHATSKIWYSHLEGGPTEPLKRSLSQQLFVTQQRKSKHHPTSCAHLACYELFGDQKIGKPKKKSAGWLLLLTVALASYGPQSGTPPSRESGGIQPMPHLGKINPLHQTMPFWAVLICVPMPVWADVQ